MFAMGGEGPMAMTFVWIMLGILSLFLLLRLYTRIVLLAALGMDDYLYISAFVCSRRLAIKCLRQRVE